MASSWAPSDLHNQGMDQQLGQKLLWTTLELEKLKSQVMEEMEKNQQYVKLLINRLKQALNERDEARNQLQKFLITKITFDPTNSNITESNCSLSDIAAYNFPGQSPPVELKTDHASLMIEILANGRALPEKGKLLQAMLEVGPLLQTLLLAEPLPLPQWRNPPQLQPFQVSPSNVLGQKLGSFASRQGLLSFEHGSSGMMCNFLMVSSGMSSMNLDPLAKRRRLC